MCRTDGFSSRVFCFHTELSSVFIENFRNVQGMDVTLLSNLEIRGANKPVAISVPGNNWLRLTSRPHHQADGLPFLSICGLEFFSKSRWNKNCWNKVYTNIFRSFCTSMYKKLTTSCSKSLDFYWPLTTSSAVLVAFPAWFSAVHVNWPLSSVKTSGMVSATLPLRYEISKSACSESCLPSLYHRMTGSGLPTKHTNRKYILSVLANFLQCVEIGNS